MFFTLCFEFHACVLRSRCNVRMQRACLLFLCFNHFVDTIWIRGFSHNLKTQPTIRRGYALRGGECNDVGVWRSLWFGARKGQTVGDVTWVMYDNFFRHFLFISTTINWISLIHIPHWVSHIFHFMSTTVSAPFAHRHGTYTNLTANSRINNQTRIIIHIANRFELPSPPAICVFVLRLCSWVMQALWVRQ